MPLENLNVARVCLHEVYKRTDDRNVVPPSFATGLLDLDDRGLAAFEARVVAAFRSGAKCMEMTINEIDETSVAARGVAMVGVSDNQFVRRSRAFAEMLASAQTSRQYPGGLVVVFDGTVGNPATRFFGIMKAEMHEGFVKRADMQATFVDSLFLSPKTKLYKIGLFVANDVRVRDLPDGWTATVYDAQLTAVQRDSAALYFHESFLGLTVPENSAQQTKIFFQKTKEFIAEAAIDEDQRVGLHNSLYTYLKHDRSPTIQVSRFADAYMPDDVAMDYQRYMRRERFPVGAVQKDLTEISGRLRTRRLRFANRITLTGPADAINEFVSVEEIRGERGASWTRITVRSQLESQD